MSEPIHCPDCGAELNPGLPTSLCPRCGLRGALELGDAATTLTPALSHPMGEGERRAGEGMAGRSFGDYELLEEIARGGMGIVFKARQQKLDRVVAVKMILAGEFASKEQALRFRAEAEAAARLQHSNIVRIHETGEQDGQPYFSMDYIEGGNLTSLVREKPLPAKRAAGYVKTIAEAIHYAHEQGILHRDLKPSNVLIDHADQPHVTDFGLAKRMTKESFLTVTGDAMGSPGFMPPEQAGYRGSRREEVPVTPEVRGPKSEVDQSLATSAAAKVRAGRYSDVYGLGAILFYLVTGRPPFTAESIAETLHHVLNTEPMSPRLLNPSVPQDIATICLKCLEKEPAKRFSTARELADELGYFLNDEPIQSRPVSAPEKMWRWYRRNPTLAGFAAVVVLMAGVGLAGWLKARYQSEEAEKALEQKLAAEKIAEQEIQQSAAILIANTDLLLKQAFGGTNDTRIPVLLKALEDTIQAHPNEFVFWQAKAQVFVRMDRLLDAIAAITQAIQHAQANTNVPVKSRVELLLTRSGLYRAMGRHQDAYADYVEAGQTNCEARGIEKRPPETSAEMLDLSPFFRSELSSWLNKLMVEDEGGNEPLRDRIHRDTGVQFDLRGVLDLLSLSDLSKLMQKEAAEPLNLHGLPSRLPPNGLTGVAVHQRFAKLHVLHGCWDVAPLPSRIKARIAKYVLHYADGTTEDIHVQYGRHLRDIWRRDPLAATNGPPVIQGKALPGKPGGRMQLFHATFNNPRPEAEVTTLDLVVRLDSVSPILLAATVTDGAPRTPEFWIVRAGETEEEEGLDAAMRVLDEAAKESSDEPRLWHLRGKWLERRQRTNDALKAYSAAIAAAERAGKKVSAFHKDRANVLLALGRFDEAAVDACLGTGALLRPIGTRRELIDLSAHYHEPLYPFVVKQDQSSIQEFSDVLLQKTGVEFDVRGFLSAYGRMHDLDGFGIRPTSIVGIPIRQRLTRLHILHFASYGEAIGKKIGSYVFHYEDGSTRELPIVYGDNIRTYAEKASAPAAERISIEPTLQLTLGYIYKVVWQNPRPDVEIVSVDFNSTRTDSAPALLAMTAE